jgi:hypothetical protein
MDALEGQLQALFQATNQADEASNFDRKDIDRL